MFTALRTALKRDGIVTFSVRVHPGAPRSGAKGAMADGTIKIDIAAAPEDGKANAELIRFLAEEFGVPKSCVEIVSGLTARRKTVWIGIRT